MHSFLSIRFLGMGFLGQTIECCLKNVRDNMSLNKKTYHHENVDSSKINT